MSKKPELIYCPFCGGETEIVESNEFRADGIIEYPHCTMCGAHQTCVKDDSISEWNSRVYPPEIKAAIERDTPQKPIQDILSWRCPKCKSGLETMQYHKVCPDCGQRLDWL